MRSGTSYVLKTKNGKFLDLDEGNNGRLVDVVSKAVIFDDEAYVLTDEELHDLENDVGESLSKSNVIIMEEENFNELMRIRGRALRPPFVTIQTGLAVIY